MFPRSIARHASVALASALVLVAVAACQSSAPAPVAQGPTCPQGAPMCSPDRRAVVAPSCDGRYLLLKMCNGRNGCSQGPQGIACDDGLAAPAPAPTPVAGGAGIPCAAEGGYSCSPDGATMLQCRGGRTAVASTCKGARRCTEGAAIACDASIADLGDPCDSEGKTACARDGRMRLRCTRGSFVAGEACAQVACMASNGRVLCQ